MIGLGGRTKRQLKSLDFARRAAKKRAEIATFQEMTAVTKVSSAKKRSSRNLVSPSKHWGRKSHAVTRRIEEEKTNNNNGKKRKEEK